MGQEQDEKYLILRSYSNIWRIERSLEHINGVKIPTTPLIHAAYIMATLGVELFIWLKIPFIKDNVSIFVIFGTAFGISTFLKIVKLDGKNPIKYFISLGEFLIYGKCYLRFRAVNEVEDAGFDELIPYRRIKVVKGVR